MMTAGRIRSLFARFDIANTNAIYGRTVVTRTIFNSQQRLAQPTVESEYRPDYRVQSQPKVRPVYIRPTVDMDAVQKGRLRGHRSGRSRNRY